MVPHAQAMLFDFPEPPEISMLSPTRLSVFSRSPRAAISRACSLGVIIDCDMQNVKDLADQGPNALSPDQFPPGFSELRWTLELLGPDNDFDPAIDLLFLDGSRLGCNKP